jgi:hypothetical protein
MGRGRKGRERAKVSTINLKQVEQRQTYSDGRLGTHGA